MRKRITAALLCLCMIVTLLPQKAIATSNGKDIQLGVNAVTTNSILWFGHYDNAPINWQVTTTSPSSLGLVSEYVLFNAIYDNNYYVEDNPALTYQTSLLYTTTLLNFKNNSSNFSSSEQGVMGSVGLPAYNMGGAYDRNGGGRQYWLGKALTKLPQSSDPTTLLWHGYCCGDGFEDPAPLDRSFGIRPAFDFNLASILFTSAAVGGKLSNNVGAGALSFVPDYSGSEWKLTLKESSRSTFTARISGGATSATVEQGGNIAIDYANAKTGSNEYISVMITDNDGNALYYGNIANNSSSGMAEEITIPATLPAGSYTLKIFNEQCNGDKKTDYSSTFVDIPLTVTTYPVSEIDVKFIALGANGSDIETTSQLFLYFDPEIADLRAEDITLTGADKGQLTKEASRYKLLISNITVADNENVRVTINKAGYRFTSTNSLSVRVRVRPATTCTITASVNNSAYGSITGGGSVPIGADVTLTATANAGYKFVNWTENGKVVSNFAHYTFTATGNRNLVAVFAANSSGSGGNDGSAGGGTGGGSITPSPETVYHFNDGSKGTWGKGESSGFSITCNGDFKKFKSLSVDGTAVAGSNYTVKSGSTIVTFAPEYLKTLSVGEHTLRLAFSDGYAQTTFTIAQAENPNTGLENPFTDVSKSDWFYDDVLFVYGRKIMAGTRNRTFSPHNAATRGMMATIRWRMEGSPAVTGTSPYTDVASGKYYTDAAIWTTQKGILNGYEDKTFRAEESITREQLAAIFYHYAKYEGYDLSPSDNLSKFTDKQEVSPWANEAMQWAVGSGLISGKGNQTLDPKGTATRAEIAAMLHRFIKKHELVEGIAPSGQMG